MTHDKPFESVPKIYEFAYSIAEKKSINHNKKQHKIENHADSLINHFQSIEERNRKNAETDDQYKQLMYLAGETLPRQCKQVFQQHYIYRLKNVQIARKLGITKRTVETHMTKAYQILRLEMKKKGKLYIFSITLIL
jgi:RNA polymerase sigma-70 factor (ECF subfamily)